MATDSSYIQNQIRLDCGTCEICKKKENVFRIEWRVDWFQGNCEYEEICSLCCKEKYDRDLLKEEQEEKKRAAYYKKMAPIWEKQRIERLEQERILEEQQKKGEKLIPEIASKYGLELKTYPNGQYSFGNVLDWWTTTGTAIERKTQIRHTFGFEDYKDIDKLLNNLIK